MKIPLAAALALTCSASAFAETHKYKPTAGVQTFAVRPPVLTIKPGDIVETETFSKPGDYYDPAVAGPWPGEVGPFFIEGAAPGDTLLVRILKLTPNRDIAVSNVRPNGISGVAGDSRTRMLNDPLPAKRFIWRLDRARMMGVLDIPASASKRIEVPLRPMLGRVAVAPAGRKRGAVCGPAISAATSMRRTSHRARPFICRSSIPVRSSTSAISTHCRGMARSPAPGWSRPPTSPSGSS